MSKISQQLIFITVIIGECLLNEINSQSPRQPVHCITSRVSC